MMILLPRTMIPLSKRKIKKSRSGTFYVDDSSSDDEEEERKPCILKEKSIQI